MHRSKGGGPSAGGRSYDPLDPAPAPEPEPDKPGTEERKPG
ncbi:hypothetical protein SAMN05421803_1633 [Nocardiopsis flavescens]|uniref:Uncharacterized protein n=1 Tax=Nocardiopsis flavescens TaxID=758803 RepID=A0A1M6X3W1_9ACTN|nr:hypothetical protein [Nocardiopsis flavescens]SHL00485.1 hypothetical protein SAMN05421803_1633 [Nocardiopsis flavescens]